MYYVAKTKALISFAITAKLICVFVFAYAKVGFLMMQLKLGLSPGGSYVCVWFQYELLCCVQDDQDSAIGMVDKLKERYPKVDCKLFIGKHPAFPCKRKQF